MDQEHSIISPSGLYRVMACPGSVAESQYAPVKPPSIYAQRGTLQHEAVPLRWQGKSVTHLELSNEELNHVDDCCDYLKELINGRPHKIVFEVRGTMEHIGLPDIWGTCDVIIVFLDDNTIHVIDWKFGHGVAVLVDDNPQSFAYLVMALKEHTYSQMFIHIAQPPLGYYGIQQVYDSDVEKFIETLKQTVVVAQSPNAPLVPGDKQCQFCPAAMTCRARFDMQTDTAKEVFAAIPTLKGRIVTPEERADLYTKLKQLKAYQEELGKQGFEDLLEGRRFPGYKLVRGRSTRKWKSEENAKRWLIKYMSMREGDLYEKKMLSPPKVEKKIKALKKDPDFHRLVDKPEGKLTMVPEDDKREAYNPNDKAKEVFNDLI